MAHISQDFDGPATITGADRNPPRQPPRVIAAESSGWIPVGERLPERQKGSFSERVLVRVNTGRGAVAAIDSYIGESWGWSMRGHEVTHWQPLPPVELEP